MEQEHVEVVDVVTEPQRLWQPVVGEETRRLLDDAGLDDEAQRRVQNQAVEVLARCNPPSAGGADPRTGLVVGYVQSGKTLSFTTVTALARDNGFPLVVLFAGTKDNLHRQTARRLGNDLKVERPGGLSPWYLSSNPRAAGADLQAIGQHLKRALDPKVPEKFRRTVVVTVMKNPTRLSAVRDLLLSLDQYGVSLSNLPSLVIDDEADQAGLNTLAQDQETSATYREIVQLRKVLPQHSYVMYTATPQAPLLLNLADTLSPDFVAVLEPGDQYTGGEYFFVTHRKRFLQVMSSAEAQQALDPGLADPPDSLQRALATYFLGLAARGGAGGQVSMLVHPSHTQDLHDKYTAWVTAIAESWQDTLSTPGSDRDALVEEVFAPAHADLDSAGTALPSLDELLEHLPYWISETQIRKVNSDQPEQSQIQWNVSPSWILVGGNKLDRGFTVEGLTVTYMPRGTGVGNADTIQQRARFFGYKGSYGHLCRAWLAPSTADAFEHYVEHETELRKELLEVARSGTSLKQWKRRMLLDPSFKPCRRAVVDLPYLHARIKGDAWTSFSNLRIDESDIRLNRSSLRAFLTDHEGAAQRHPEDNRPGDRHHTLFTVGLEELLRRLLTEWKAHVEDRVTLNQALLLLNARLDQQPALVADVYLMDGRKERQRSLLSNGVTVNNLQQGRSPNGSYQGDAKFFSDGTVSLQVYNVTLRKDKSTVLDEVPGLALWVPRQLAGGALIQLTDPA